MRFRHEITTDIRIHAPAETVWRVLTDLNRYHEWNPFFVAVDVHDNHRLQPGTTLVLHTAAHPRLRPLPARVQVRELDPPRRIEWGGGLPIPGLAQGIHGFHLTAETDETTHVRHFEYLTGALIPITGRLLSTLKHRYDDLNAALAARAETGRDS